MTTLKELPGDDLTPEEIEKLTADKRREEADQADDDGYYEEQEGQSEENND